MFLSELLMLFSLTTMNTLETLQDWLSHLWLIDVTELYVVLYTWTMEVLLKVLQVQEKLKQSKIFQKPLLDNALSSTAQMVWIISKWQSSSKVLPLVEHGVALMSSIELSLKYCLLLPNSCILFNMLLTRRWRSSILKELWSHLSSLATVLSLWIQDMQVDQNYLIT